MQANGAPGTPKRVRTLVSLFGLYVVALVSVVVLDDGADVGVVLLGVAAHTFYAAQRLVRDWRVSATLAAARTRLAPRYA